ncbi:MAG: hypothetical protein J0H49_23175, partial [Acidobacteria bacterium]|nr:hypothetical protein [Acidobacteriota bacterium]
GSNTVGPSLGHTVDLWSGNFLSDEQHHPFPPNYQQQWDICNLYPLLIHLNLFGKSHLGNILHTIQRF